MSKSIYTKTKQQNIWGRERIYEVARDIPAEELDRRIKRLERDRHLYRGMGVEEAAELVGGH